MENNNLEKALKGLGEKPENTEKSENLERQPQMSKEEEIGFHKGSINTLLGERNELVKMLQNVEMIMQQHIKRLQELGVDIQTRNK